VKNTTLLPQASPILHRAGVKEVAGRNYIENNNYSLSFYVSFPLSPVMCHTTRLCAHAREGVKVKEVVNGSFPAASTVTGAGTVAVLETVSFACPVFHNVEHMEVQDEHRASGYRLHPAL
jgi:hypothetical protein